MRIRGKRRGMALLLSLMMLPLLAILAFCLTTMGVNNLNTARVRENSKQAAYVAEAGVEEGLQRLKADTDYTTESGWTTNSPSTPFHRTMLAGVAEVATVRIWNNHYGSSVETVPVTGAQVPIGYAYVLATASEPGGQTRRQAAILCKLIGSAPSPWNYATVGFDMIKLGGTKTLVDSYDSSKGSFTATRIGFNGASAELGGNIASGTSPGSSTTAGTIQFNSGNKVAGRVDILEGGNPGGTAGQEFVAMSTLENPIYNRPVKIPTLEQVPFTGGTLTPDKHYTGAMNRNITLSTSGDYVFDDFVSSYITITPGAKVNIYVTGNNGGSVDLTMLNVIRNPDGSRDPEYVPNPLSPAQNVTLYVGPGIPALTLQGTKSYASCRFYAPHTDVLFRSANFHLFGSISGKSVENRGNMEISWDRSMKEPSIPPDALVRYRERM